MQYLCLLSRASQVWAGGIDSALSQVNDPPGVDILPPGLGWRPGETAGAKIGREDHAAIGTFIAALKPLYWILDPGDRDHGWALVILAPVAGTRGTHVHMEQAFDYLFLQLLVRRGSGFLYHCTGHWSLV